MSVYRHLTADDLETIRRAAGVRSLGTPEPIAAGIENSNWFLTLDDAETVVLTVLEAAVDADLPFCIALTDTLAAAGLPVPVARQLADGARTLRIQERPALLVQRLRGVHAERATAAQCAAAGRMLAQMHRTAATLPAPDRPRDRDWWPAAFAGIAPTLAADARTGLHAALQTATATFVACRDEPHGIIHGDFFRDNVLFDGERISGVLDFFHAAHDLLAWDLAIALNDWTMTEHAPDPARADALLAGYEEVRPLTAGECAALPALRRAAAARFWLSRLLFARRPAARGQRKDPEEMRAWYRALSG
ncbi:MAG: homoserine kinase [Pseudomonadota bacterium]